MTKNGSEQAFRESLAGLTPEIAAQQLNDKVGMEFGQLSPERVTATMPVEGNLQPYGLLHGGANAVLAEALGSTVAALNAGDGRIAVGVDLNCTHHRAVTSGIVTAVATPVHVGRSAVTAEIVITDEAGRRSCTARLTCMVRDAPPAG
ncbi:hotdog fold thioesterase [Prauserella alba]|uniref:Hotdog fold thioesterase n=1 Tax=Prauserella alba TaxID=176898 RepID=A0ABP4G2N0_9PSEU|nr:hotdog fold thioesterase [Prauserella alba]MCP2182734.1 putative domain 1-containing protein [Prauserella alba]